MRVSDHKDTLVLQLILSSQSLPFSKGNVYVLYCFISTIPCISQKLIKLLLSGTCASDEAAAIYLCKSDILPSLIELLKAKQEDDEIVLQVVYVFYQLCSHAASRQFVKVGPISFRSVFYMQ